MLRRLMLVVVILVSLPTWAQGLYPYPSKAEIADALKEASDVVGKFDELTTHLSLDTWNAPGAFRGRQKFLLSDAQEGMDDVRDDIEGELEAVSSGKQASANDLLTICTKVSEIYHFADNLYAYSYVFHADAAVSEINSVSELAFLGKTASIHCGGILIRQVQADSIRANLCKHPTSH
jgi:hypothetical protein